MLTLDEIEKNIEKLKMNEISFERALKDAKMKKERTMYLNRIVFLGISDEEIKEISRHFNSVLYILPDDLEEINFDTNHRYVFMHIRENILEEKSELIKEIIWYYAALCEDILEKRKLFFIEAYENPDDFSKYSTIRHHVDYKIRKRSEN